MDLAAQALENLVNQFARPMDFLRELVQNAIDAGSPRIEVAVRWSGGRERGIVSLHVDDFGSGMNEAIIDDQLTRLFSSSKEGDLTKIGKFGIGFTSVFALRPQAVLVVTGRDGEGWEVLFHADRTFDKVRLERPVVGTKVTLYKELAWVEVPALVADARRSLAAWCIHASRPITFLDATSVVPDETAPAPSPTLGESPATSDPFAAFAASTAAPSGPVPEGINRPFDVEGALLREHALEEGLEIVAGYADRPQYGWYNAGLTLVQTDQPDALGPFADRLRDVSFKVRSPRLKHTLTRDNVIQDETWHAAMNRVVEVADRLRSRLVEATVAAAGLPSWPVLVATLATEARRDPAWGRKALRDAPVFQVYRGHATLAQVEAAEDALGALVRCAENPALAEIVHDEGILQVDAAALPLLDALPPPPRFGRFQRTRTVVRPEDTFAFPRLLPASDLTPEERAICDAAGPRVVEATRGKVSLRFADFPGMDDLLVEGGEQGRLFWRRPAWWHRLVGYVRRRRLVINRHHPDVVALVHLASAYPQAAGVALAALALLEEGLVSPETARAVVPAEEGR